MSANRIRRHNDPNHPGSTFLQRFSLQAIHLNPQKSMENMGNGYIKARSIANARTYNKRRHIHAAL